MVQAAVFHNVCARCFSAEWTPVHVYHLSSHSASFTLFHQNPGTSLKRHNLKPHVGNLVTNPPRGQNGICGLHSIQPNSHVQDACSYRCLTA